MSVAWVAVGATVLGAAAGADSSRRASNTQADIAREQMTAADRQLDAQVQSANDLLTFNKQVYEDGRARQVGVDALNTRVINQQMNIAQDSADRSADSWDFYKRNGRPVVQQSLDDAKNFDSQEEIDAARGRATADVNRGFDSAQQQSQRALTRMGINPNSGRFLAMQNRLQIEKSGALAGAATQAEDSRRIGAVQLRQQASNLAQGFPVQSMGQAGQSVGAGSAAASVAGGGQAQNLALTGQALSGMASGSQLFGSAANGYSNLYGAASNSANNIAASGNQAAAGWGQLAGMGMSLFKPNTGGGNNIGTGAAWSNEASVDAAANGGGWYADGGKIRGPGTGTSDSIHAVNGDNGQQIRLSNGEYIISADVVRAKGTKFFDDLQAKHHKPVNGNGNLGRAAA